jgi:hypothetical protein
MMSWAGPVFVLVLMAIGPIAWVVTTAIRAHYGYPLKGRLGTGADYPAATRHVELLESENAALRGKLGRVEERVAVLERLATDPARRLSNEIETLRVAGH